MRSAPAYAAASIRATAPAAIASSDPTSAVQSPQRARSPPTPNVASAACVARGATSFIAALATRTAAMGMATAVPMLNPSMSPKAKERRGRTRRVCAGGLAAPAAQ